MSMSVMGERTIPTMSFVICDPEAPFLLPFARRAQTVSTRFPTITRKTGELKAKIKDSAVDNSGLR